MEIILQVHNLLESPDRSKVGIIVTPIIQNSAIIHMQNSPILVKAFFLTHNNLGRTTVVLTMIIVHKI